jgi:hypothetical protein
MELTYRQLEITLSAALRIKPDRVGTFRSRIKQLQRLEFPSGVNVGRGTKMAYSAEHLFKLGFAFELIGAGLPAMLAARIVEKNWHKFGASVATDMRNRMRFFFSTSMYVRLIIRTLDDLQFDIGASSDVAVFVEDHAALSEVLRRNSSRVSNSYLVVCVTDFTDRILKRASEVGGVPDALYSREILGWLVPTAGTEWLRLEGDYTKANDAKVLRHLTDIHGPEHAAAVLAILKASDGSNSET